MTSCPVDVLLMIFLKVDYIWVVNAHILYGILIKLSTREIRRCLVLIVILTHYVVVLSNRELPALAKNYVMRMLFLDQPLPQAAVALWVKKDCQK